MTCTARAPVQALAITLLIHLKTPSTSPELVPGCPPRPSASSALPVWPPASPPLSLLLDSPGSQGALHFFRKPLPLPDLELGLYPLQTLKEFKSNMVAVQMQPVSSK